LPQGGAEVGEGDRAEGRRKIFLGRGDVPAGGGGEGRGRDDRVHHRAAAGEGPDPQDAQAEEADEAPAPGGAISGSLSFVGS